MTDTQDNTAPIASDLIEGAAAIAAYLGGKWDARRVRQARDRGWSTPIRRREMGLYALKSELDAWLKADDTLPERKNNAA
jgi:hypothetical protein